MAYIQICLNFCIVVVLSDIHRNLILKMGITDFIFSLYAFKKCNFGGKLT